MTCECQPSRLAMRFFLPFIVLMRYKCWGSVPLVAPLYIQEERKDSDTITAVEPRALQFSKAVD